MSDTGVHAAHCCASHGCKYCEDDCPVVSGQVKQMYLCEECENEAMRVDFAMRKAVELGVMVDTPAMRSALLKIINAAYEMDH